MFYPLFVDANLNLDTHILSASETVKKNARFYYMEKTDNSAEAVLVPRKQRHSNSTGESRQLFHSLPVGFVDHNDLVYLFDSDRACAYIMTMDLKAFRGGNTDRQTISRINRVSFATAIFSKYQ